MIFSGLQNKQKLSTGYEKQSDDEVISNFRSEKWENLNSVQKTQVLQELENREAAKQGREPAKVTSLNGDNYGGYNSCKESIGVNTGKYVGGHENTSYEVLDTYYHESRHACQEHAKSAKDLSLDDSSYSQIQLENQRDKSGRLYNYESSGHRYDMQSSEMDSNNYAANKMMDHFDSFSDDKKYGEYLESRAEQFKNVNSVNEKLGEDRKNMQIDNINRTYQNKGISSQKRDELLSDVKSGKEEKVVTDSKNTQKRAEYYSEHISEYRNNGNKTENNAKNSMVNDITAKQQQSGKTYANNNTPSNSSQATSKSAQNSR